MTITFSAKNAVQSGNSLKLQLHFCDNDPHTTSPSTTSNSPEYLINCLVLFQAKIIRYDRKLLYYVTLKKKRNNDITNYIVNYNHRLNSENGVSREQTVHVESCCHLLLAEYQTDRCIFFVSLTLSPIVPDNPCASVYEDNELTDVELRGADGSVHLHKAIAAAMSPVMKTGFTGEWAREPKCVIDAPPNTTKETLQQLKDYMYLSKLPSTGKEQLLLLASFYMMPDLEIQCVRELVTDITAEQAYNLFEFAMKHQMSHLMFEIIHRVQNGVLNVEDIQSYQKY